MTIPVRKEKKKKKGLKDPMTLCDLEGIQRVAALEKTKALNLPIYIGVPQID